jgi:hypothetical protein
MSLLRLLEIGHHPYDLLIAILVMYILLILLLLMMEYLIQSQKLEMDKMDLR